MNVKGFTELEIHNELKCHFKYYESYKNFLDMSYDDAYYQPRSYSFKEKKIGAFFVDPSPKTYNLYERIDIISSCLQNNNVFKFFNEEIEQNFLLLHEYKQFPFFPNNLLSLDFLEKYSSDFCNMSSSYGIKIDAKIHEFILQVFFLPFLLNYQDINILVYEKYYFYRINHHLDVFKILVL